jgi:hypothetical protein
MVNQKAGLADLTENPRELTNGDEREPLFDVPDNLRRDGSNYVEWIWSLLDEGIDIPLSGSFAGLRTAQGEPLLDTGIAAYLDGQLKIAWRAASGNSHGIEDVVICCGARGLDGGPLADELSRLFFTDCELALSRAKAIGEICDVAEAFCKEAVYLKRALATDFAMPRKLRLAIDDAAANEQEDGHD